MERWKTIASIPGYEISSLGRVRNIIVRRGSYVGRILKPSPWQNAAGITYLFVNLHVDKQTKRRSIHRLVCEAFHGPCPPDKSHAAHRNSRSMDNRAKNLYWATAKENCADKVLSGTAQRGSRQASAVLTESDIPHIREALAQGKKQKDVARLYRVDRTLISKIARRINWTHVA